MTHIEDLFPLASSKRLYGRETDLGSELAILDRAAMGTCQLLLISGETGIGKTTLARSVEQPLRDIQGFFLSGKFEQQASHRPLAAFLDALDDLAVALSTQVSENDVDWARLLARELGSNLTTLVDLVPGMAAICGAQERPVELDPESARGRMIKVVVDMLRLITEQGRVIVLFLDDLHWADPATLALLREILRSGVAGTMIIGAYRSDEPDAEYALDALTEEQRAGRWPAQTEVTHLKLRALTTFDIQSVLSSKLGAERSRFRELSALCQEHCHGNPFRLQQFLIALYSRKLLHFDEATSCWHWDADGIQRLERSQDIVDLVRLRLEALPLHMTFILAKAACLGTRFQLQDVAELCGLPINEVRRWVAAAIREGLLQESLQMARSGGIEISESATFLHDQIESAAYLLQDEEARADTHLQIGWLLADRRRRDVLDAAGHLLLARHLLTQENQQEGAALVMLRASNAARRFTGWQRTFRYSRAGMELLGENAWEEHRELAFLLGRNMFEAAFYAAPDTDFDNLLSTFMQKSLSALQKAEFLWIRCSQLLVQAEMQLSQQYGFEALRMCIPSLPPIEQITSADLARLQRSVEAKLEALPQDWLSALPETDDNLTRFAWHLLPEFLTSAFISGNQLMRGFLCLTAMNLMLENGRIAGNYFALAAYALYLGVTNQIKHAARVSEVPVSRPDYSIDERLFASSNLALVPRALHYVRPFSECVELLERGERAALSVGSPILGAASLSNAATLRLASGAPLADTAAQVEKYLDSARNSQAAVMEISISIYLSFIAALREDPEEITVLDAFRFVEERLQQVVTAQRDWTEQLRLQIAFWRKETQLLPALLERARQHSFVLRGMPQLIEYHFIEFYCLLHDLAPCGKVLREERMQLARTLISEAAACGPANYSHLKSLMDAEQAWQQQDEDLALMLYQHAVREARLHDNLPYLGLSRERLAHLLDARGDTREAREVLQDAANTYRLWGCRSAAGRIARF